MYTDQFFWLDCNNAALNSESAWYMDDSGWLFQFALPYICQWWLTFHFTLLSADTSTRRMAHKLSIAHVAHEVSIAHVYPLLGELALLRGPSPIITSQTDTPGDEYPAKEAEYMSCNSNVIPFSDGLHQLGSLNPFLLCLRLFCCR